MRAETLTPVSLRDAVHVALSVADRKPTEITETTFGEDARRLVYEACLAASLTTLASAYALSKMTKDRDAEQYASIALTAALMAVLRAMSRVSPADGDKTVVHRLLAFVGAFASSAPKAAKTIAAYLSAAAR